MQTTDRRFFLKCMVVGGIALQIPFVFSCNTDSLDTVTIQIDNKTFDIDLNILRRILDILFPKSKYSPSASQLKSDIYYIWTLKDRRLEADNRTLLALNLIKFAQFSVEKTGKKFTELNLEEQKDLVKVVSATHWGENFLSRSFTIIFESMFANPVYGSNPDKIGWNWLNYKGGIPEPQKWNKYPEILSIKNQQNEKD